MSVLVWIEQNNNAPLANSFEVLGKARELAGLSLWEFRQWLGLRRIEAHYDADDLQDDLETLRERGRLG